MLNKSKWIRPALVAGLLSLSAGSSQAQYGGFGGWGGWGGGASTPMQGAGIGMGAMAMGAGQYNLDSSMARSMNVDTNLRLSQAMAQSQHYMNWTNMLHRERKSKANIKKGVLNAVVLLGVREWIGVADKHSTMFNSFN